MFEKKYALTHRFKKNLASEKAHAINHITFTYLFSLKRFQIELNVGLWLSKPPISICPFELIASVAN